MILIPIKIVGAKKEPNEYNPQEDQQWFYTFAHANIVVLISV